MLACFLKWRASSFKPFRVVSEFIVNSLQKKLTQMPVLGYENIGTRSIQRLPNTV